MSVPSYANINLKIYNADVCAQIGVNFDSSVGYCSPQLPGADDYGNIDLRSISDAGSLNYSQASIPFTNATFTKYNPLYGFSTVALLNTVKSSGVNSGLLYFQFQKLDGSLTQRIAFKSICKNPSVTVNLL